MRSLFAAIVIMIGLSAPVIAQAETPVPTRAGGVRTETEPPAYARGPAQIRDLTGWRTTALWFGAEQRLRFEDWNDLARPGLVDDTRWLSRTRLFVAWRPPNGAVALTVEAQDARQFSSVTPDGSSVVDQADLLQAFLELRDPRSDARLGGLALRAGRMSFDFADRRQFGRNRWRNTSNQVDGIRLLAGTRDDAWFVDVFAGRPVRIRGDRWNRVVSRQTLFMASVRRSLVRPRLALEPYVLAFDDDEGGSSVVSFGVHLFGETSAGHIDYDLGLARQGGTSGELDRRAWAAQAEIGWRPSASNASRYALTVAYASGDDDPDDDVDNHFSRLFQPSHPYAVSDLARWENLAMGRLQVTRRVRSWLNVTASVATYRLASARGAWTATGLVDPSGASGTGLGEEFVVALRVRPLRRVTFDGGVSWWIAEDFARSLGGFDQGTYVHVQWTVRV